MYTRTGILALCGLIAACAPAENPRQPIENSLYTRDWQFMPSTTALDLAAAQASRNWVPVQLPHTPEIDTLDTSTPFQGDSWYRKTITPAPGWQGKHISLVFEAAMNTAEVWLNGEKVGAHLGGFLPFQINLTEKLYKDKPSELLIRLDNRDNPITGPKPLKELDFNTYGGIYRPVYLRIENDLHITDAVAANKPGCGGVRVSYPEITNERALIDIQTHVANSHYDPKQFRIVQRLMRGEKVIVDQGSPLLHIKGNSEQQHSVQLTLQNPQLWSPQTPNLYQLVTRVYDGNSLVEEQTTRIGIRKFEFANGELLINGKKTRLRAVNRYQEYPYVGFATSAAADYRDAVHIKSAGFDAVRLTHYPQSTAFLDAADELGLIVLNTIPGWQYFSEDPAFQIQAQQTCRDLIRRDRNHPSVLAWECSLGDADVSDDFSSIMIKIVHDELPDALTAGSSHEMVDIVLANTKDVPAKRSASTPAFWITEDTTDTPRDAYPDIAFAQTYGYMFDYNRGYAPHLQRSGIMSIDRQPKFDYYFFQSQRDASEQSATFSAGPMIFIASKWIEDASLNIPVYSNADEVELLLNGKSLGKKTQPRSDQLIHLPFVFTVGKFIPGELKAVAYRNGKTIAEHKVTTPGKASSLRLQVNTAGKPPQSGVKDMLFVYAQLSDATGNPLYSDGVSINFIIEGTGRLLSPAQSLTHQGVAGALVEIGDSLEGLQIVAQAEGLAPATLKIK